MNGEGEHEHIDECMDGVVGIEGIGGMGDRRKIELLLHIEYVRRVIRVSMLGVRCCIDPSNMSHDLVL